MTIQVIPLDQAPSARDAGPVQRFSLTFVVRQRPAGPDLGIESQTARLFAVALNAGVVGAVVDKRPSERRGVEGLAASMSVTPISM